MGNIIAQIDSNNNVVSIKVGNGNVISYENINKLINYYNKNGVLKINIKTKKVDLLIQNYLRFLKNSNTNLESSIVRNTITESTSIINSINLYGCLMIVDPGIRKVEGFNNQDYFYEIDTDRLIENWGWARKAFNAVKRGVTQAARAVARTATQAARTVARTATQAARTVARTATRAVSAVRNANWRAIGSQLKNVASYVVPIKTFEKIARGERLNAWDVVDLVSSVPIPGAALLKTGGKVLAKAVVKQVAMKGAKKFGKDQFYRHTNVGRNIKQKQNEAKARLRNQSNIARSNIRAGNAPTRGISFRPVSSVRPVYGINRPVRNIYGINRPIKNIFKPIRKAISPAVYKIGRAISPAARQIRRAVSPAVYKIGRAISPAARQIRRAVSPAVYKIGRAVSPAAQQIRRAVSPAVYKIGRAISPAARQIRRAISPAARQIRRAISPAVMKIRRAVSPAVMKIGRAVSPAVMKIRRAVSPAVMKIGRAVSPAAKKIGRAISPAAKKIGRAISPAAKKIGRAISPAAKKIGRAISPAVKKIGRAISPAVKKIGRAISPAAKKIGRAISPATKKIKKILKPITKAISPALTPIRRVISPALKPIKKIIKPIRKVISPVKTVTAVAGAALISARSKIDSVEIIIPKILFTSDRKEFMEFVSNNLVSNSESNKLLNIIRYIFDKSLLSSNNEIKTANLISLVVRSSIINQIILEMNKLGPNSFSQEDKNNFLSKVFLDLFSIIPSDRCLFNDEENVVNFIPSVCKYKPSVQETCPVCEECKTPRSETPVSETPRSETPVSETPRSETPVSETPESETPGCPKCQKKECDCLKCNKSKGPFTTINLVIIAIIVLFIILYLTKKCPKN